MLRQVLEENPPQQGLKLGVSMLEMRLLKKVLEENPPQQGLKLYYGKLETKGIILS